MDCSWNFSGKSCIITGAANGLGLAISKLLASSGAEVVLVDHDESALALAVEACSSVAFVKPLSVLADVSIKDDVKRMVDSTLERFDKIDFLVASAGKLHRTQG